MMAESAPAAARKADDPLSSALWMLTACATLAAVATMGRYLTSSGLPAVQLVFLRSILIVIMLSPLLLRRGVELVTTDRPGLYLVRVIVTGLAMTTWFASLAYIPVGEVTAISFLAPLFTTVGAALVLGEAVHARRWIATCVGFAGALVISRPGISEFSIGTGLAILSAVAMGASYLFIKFLSRRDDPNKIVFLSTLLMIPVTLLPALVVWHWPEPQQWGVIAAVGVATTLGHGALTRAISAADASFATSLDFLRLPFAVAFGYLAFGEMIDLWTWIGAGIVFASSFYIANREKTLGKRAAPAPGA
ncbi:MAG: DMT family transporter [Hyphomicrobiales bacterium]